MLQHPARKNLQHSFLTRPLPSSLSNWSGQIFPLHVDVRNWFSTLLQHPECDMQHWSRKFKFSSKGFEFGGQQNVPQLVSKHSEKKVII